MKRSLKLPKFLTTKPAIWVTVLLLLQAAGLYSSIRPEVIPNALPLAQVPVDLNGWRSVRDYPMEPEIQEVLQADDTLSRLYVKGNQPLTLFVAAFKSQRTGRAPHSPKNCLPGSGWLPLSQGEISVDVGRQIPVNRYVISHGEERQLVLYWYQSRDRVVANEFKAKFWVMYDALRLNRTDTALVRVIVPIQEKNEAAAEQVGIEFVKTLFDPLRQYLPV
jgi:EpsI family protein